MNIVDYVIIGVLGVSVLYGLYRGFVASVLSMGGGLISFLSAFALYPKLAALIQKMAQLMDEGCQQHPNEKPQREQKQHQRQYRKEPPVSRYVHGCTLQRSAPGPHNPRRLPLLPELSASAAASRILSDVHRNGSGIP